MEHQQEVIFSMYTVLRDINLRGIHDDNRVHYHDTIYKSIFCKWKKKGDKIVRVESTESIDPNLFITEHLNILFNRYPDFDFYNNLLVYLAEYLTQFTRDKKLMYIKYVCKHVYGAVSQWATKNQEVKPENFNRFGDAAIHVLSLFEAGVLGEEDKNILTNCVKPIEMSNTGLSQLFPGGNSKKRKTKNRKTKKRKTKKRKPKRPKSTRKRV